MAKHNIFKNKRGANIEIGKIRPNTYNEYCGCTVDIQIFVYNRTMNRRCKFWLVDYDTSWSGDVNDPEIDAFLVSPAYCWGELEERNLIDYDAMPDDDDFSVEDFEKEDKMDETESDRPMDEAIERAIAYCKEHDTRCLALPYAICKAMCETSFVLPRAIFVQLNSIFQTTDWESEKAAAAGLLKLRSDLLEALKKSRWVDVDNRHYKRYEYCGDIIDERNKTLQKLVTLLESMCNVRPHDVNHNYVYGPDMSADIRQLKEEHHVVMPHKIHSKTIGLRITL